MGRPRKYANDAERKAADRVRKMNKRTNQDAECPNNQDKRTELVVNGQNKRTDIEPPSKRTHENNYTPFAWHPEVDLKIFDGHGRFSPVNGFVLVSRRSEPNGNTIHGVVTEHDWRARLDQSCVHDGQRLAGWSCKECLPA